MIGEVSFTCNRVLPGLSQMLPIVSKIQADSALAQFYNKTGVKKCNLLVKGINNGKTTQIVNN